MPYCAADGSRLLILPLVNVFHDGLHAVFLRGWRRIAHSFARQWVSRWFARRIAQWILADSSYFRLSTAFLVCAPYCSADGSRLLILPLVNVFQYGLHAVLPSRWPRIAHSCTYQWLSRWFALHIARQIAHWIDYSSAHMRLCQLFACCIARRKVSRLICGFADIICVSMTFLKFYA